MNAFLVCVHKADAVSDSTRLSMFWETVPHPALVLGIWQMILPLSQLINALHSLKNSATASVQTLHRDFPPEHTSYLKEVRRTSWTATWLYVRRAQYIIVSDFGQNLNDFTYTDFFSGDTGVDAMKTYYSSYSGQPVANSRSAASNILEPSFQSQANISKQIPIFKLNWIIDKAVFSVFISAFIPQVSL